MKRYLLFVGMHCYPQGGMDDFVGDFDTLQEAEQAALNHPKIAEYYQNDPAVFWNMNWANVWDCETREEVWSK